MKRYKENLTLPVQSVKNRFVRVVLCGLLILAALVTSSCTSDPGDEGGVIGTGIILRGTVFASAIDAGSLIDVKSSDGQFTSLTINDDNQYTTGELNGISPWVLRAKTGADVSVYALVFANGTRNINSFSDLSARKWFAEQSLDLDSEFDSSGSFTEVPSSAELADSTFAVFGLIEPVLDSYGVSGPSIINEDFVGNDEGVDRFLNRNQVVLEDGLITFVFTDPTTNTQSTTRSPLTIVTDFVDTGLAPPTVPSSVRALGSAADEVVVVWNASTDDVAVIGYRVLRGGVEVGTTPYPVYVDRGLPPNEIFSYSIVAFDGAGNTSVPSMPEFASALQVSDNVSPPAPTLLTEVSVSNTSVRLLWAQENIADVASFNVYRAQGTQTPELLTRVTGTPFVDSDVQENSVYCYQVAAVDISNNVSERSEVLCVGTSAGDGSDSEVSGPLPEWNVPSNLETLNCDQTLTNADVQQGLGAGSTLRLSAGVVLKFGDAADILVPSDATLTIDGTRENPVILTGGFTVPGHWGGIHFIGSKSSANIIRGAVIQYGGGGETMAALKLSTSASRFGIEDTLVRFNRNDGFAFNRNNSVITSFSGNKITENDYAGFVTPDLLEVLSGTSEFTGNFEDEIAVSTNTYDFPISVPNLGVPFRWNGVRIRGGSLTIDAGVELIMVSGSEFLVDGEFAANGTEEEPINIRGRVSAKGSWQGFNLSGRGTKTFNHVNINHAGYSGDGNGAIKVLCTPETAPAVQIDHVDITQSLGWGIVVRGEGCDIDIGGNNTYLENDAGNVSLP